MSEPTSKSFIETALRRIRERNAQVGGVDTGRQESPEPPSRVRQPAAGQPEEAAAPRNYTLAPFDTEAMERSGVLLAVSDQTAVRAYKILRTRLQQRMAANHWTSVGVTGAGEAVGKTLTAINLAIALAQGSRTPVCLVDFDLHRPQVGAYLGMRVAKGMSDYLLGEANAEEIVYSTSVEGLTVAPGGRALQQGSELLGSPRMADFFAYLKAEQPRRTLVCDLPPLLLSDDVLVLSPHLDCVLDVISVGITSRASVERSKEILAELNVAGVVLNRVAEQEHSAKYYSY